VPVKPDIPIEVLADCLPNRTLPETALTVGDLEVWAEDLSVALERCNADKAAIRRALE
jgi:hypothetical protein